MTKTKVFENYIAFYGIRVNKKNPSRKFDMVVNTFDYVDKTVKTVRDLIIKDEKDVLKKFKESKTWFHMQASELDERNRKLIEDVKTYFPYLVIDVDHFDLYPQTRAEKIMKYFTTLPSCSYIEKSLSGTGLHIYIQINQYLTHSEFRKYYLGLMYDIYVKSKINYGFVDTAMTTSTQPVVYSNDSVYINNDSIDYGNVPTWGNDLFYTVLKRQKDEILDSDFALFLINEVLKLKRPAIPKKTQVIDTLILTKDNKGNIITEEMISDENYIELSDSVQCKIIRKIVFKNLNAEYVKKRNSGVVKHTFYVEINAALYSTFIKINLKPENILKVMLEISDDNKYVETVYKLYKHYTTDKNIFNDVVRVNAVYQYKKEINVDLMMNHLQLLSKLKKEREKKQLLNINSENTFTLKKGEKIKREMLGELDNNKTYIIADTKSGKTYSTINYFDLNSVSVLFLVPTNKLKNEVIENYNGIEYKANTTKLSVGLNVGTYDAFIHNRYIRNDRAALQYAKLIIDEVHTIITEDYRANVMSEMYAVINTGLFKTTVLMTATPTNDFKDYNKISIRFDDVTKGDLKLFANGFTNYVLTNLDTTKNNLVYVNDVNNSIQKMYNHFKSKGFICKLLISNDNKTLLNMFNEDMLNTDYQVINTYLTTKVVEVGIGLPEFINEFYINPYQKNDILSIQSFEQLLNRDNRMDLMTGERNVNVYVRNSDTYLTIDDIVRGKLSNVIINDGEYINDMIKFNESVYNSFGINETTKLLNIVDIYYSSRYINDVMYDDIEIINHKFLNKQDLSESDWELKKQDDSFNLVIDTFEKYVKDFKRNREYIYNYMINIDYSTFKQVFLIAKGYYEIGYIFDFTGLKMDIDEYTNRIENIREIKQQENVKMIIDNVYKFKQTIQSMYNFRREKDIFVFKNMKNFGVNYDKENVNIDYNTTYTVNELKQLCLENGFNYKEESKKFKQVNIRIDGKKLRVYKPVN